MCSLPKYKDISMRTGLSARRKIDRESDKDVWWREDVVAPQISVVKSARETKLFFTISG